MMPRFAHRLCSLFVGVPVFSLAAISLVAISLVACGLDGGSGPPPTLQLPIADMARASTDNGPCAVPASTLSRDTPELGYWASDCSAHCLPPKQMFSICTAKLGVLMTPGQGDFEAQSFGASREIYETACPSAPWRAWLLLAIPYPNLAATGPQSSPSIQSGCQALPKDSAQALPSDRQYYRVLGEAPHP